MLHCAIFSATCLVMPLCDKLPERFTLLHGLFRNYFLMREALHEVEISSTFCNGLQQLATPVHSVSTLKQLFPQFYVSFAKGACAQFSFFIPRSSGYSSSPQAQPNPAKICKMLRSRANVPPNLGNFQRYNFQALRDKLLRRLRSVTGP